MSVFIKALKYAVFGVTVFALFFLGGAYLTSVWVGGSATVAEADAEEGTVPDDGERTNILLLGVDARPADEHSRSDTMILASIDPKLKKVVLISIPRDTKVNINGEANKITTANYYGGPELAVAKVEEVMNIAVDNYVEVDFSGFSQIIDTLGGVTIDVEQRMYKPSEGIDLQPGAQKLDGQDALAYVRYRDYAMGDIDRTTKQQNFLKALANEMLQAKNIIKLPKLANQLNSYMETDLKISDMLRLASWAPRFSGEAIATQTLPGYFYDERDNLGTLLNSYWIADTKQAKTLVDDLFAGKTVATLVNMPAEATTKIVKYYDPPAQTVADKDTAKTDPTDEKAAVDKTETNIKDSTSKTGSSQKQSDEKNTDKKKNKRESSADSKA